MTAASDDAMDDQGQASSSSENSRFAAFLPLFDEALPKHDHDILSQRLASEPEALKHFGDSLSMLEILKHVDISNRQFCPDQQSLVAFASNSLGQAPRPKFERHLKACPMCRDDLADLHSLQESTNLELAFEWIGDTLKLVRNKFGVLVATPELALARSNSSMLSNSSSLVHEFGAHSLKIMIAYHKSGWLVQVSLQREGKARHFSALLFRQQQVIEGAVTKDCNDADSLRLTLEIEEEGDYELTVRELAHDQERPHEPLFDETVSLSLKQAR